MNEQTKTDKKGAPKWMVTFADMVTLLMCLFVMLLSFANVDNARFHDMAKSLHHVFGGPPVVPLANPRLEKQKTQIRILKILRETFQEELRENKNIFIVADNRGLKLQIIGEAMFKPGEAVLLPNAVRLLRKMIPNIRSSACKILVEGHTDDLPISSAAFPSNWELSAARAVAVVRYFSEQGKIDARRFSGALACADTKPMFENNTEGQRARNRRVDIIFKIF
ncbi:MAG: OmpA family protein [bacterium]|nr:OmpA family protein [bacterium]